MSNLKELVISYRFARRAVRRFSSVICAGETDARWLRWIGGRPSVEVVPNGVSLPDLGGGDEAEDSVPDRLRLSFSGTLNFGPNVDAIEFLVREIWPLVRSVYPDAELLIAGRNPTPAVIAYDGRSGVVVRANVPNVFSLLRQSQVSIAPMRFGSGVKNKVLEAWASGIPVVLTPLAVNGLTMPRGHERLIHSTARDLAQAVIDMFSNSSKARHLGANARQHVREHYTWRLWADRIDQLLRDAAPDHLHRRVFENPERRARAMPASTAVRSPRL